MPERAKTSNQSLAAIAGKLPYGNADLARTPQPIQLRAGSGLVASKSWANMERLGMHACLMAPFPGVESML